MQVLVDTTAAGSVRSLADAVEAGSPRFRTDADKAANIDWRAVVGEEVSARLRGNAAWGSAYGGVPMPAER